MTTKTDFEALSSLDAKYTPAKTGLLKADEVELIEKELELKQRTNIELQNVRDMAVMLYSQFAKQAERDTGTAASIEKLDAMSAICMIIDNHKVTRGLTV